MIIAYTDGSTYRTNPGPMAWAVVYVEDEEIVREEVGALYWGTNNKAEILGVIWALENETAQDLLIRTDSTLTLNIATRIWKAKTNTDLWDRYDALMAKRNFRGLKTHFEHVKGHSDNIYNRRADSLARNAAATAAECLEERHL